eukprot:jgi/Chlat1/1495/Chrsp12S02028
MSDIFRGYEREYGDLSAIINKKIAVLPTLQGEQKKQKQVEIQSDLDEAQYLIKQMELEARSVGPSLRTPLQTKIKECDDDLKKLRQAAKRGASSAASHDAARAELMESGHGDGDYAPVSSEQRAKLLTTTDRIGRSGERIKESKRTLLETEELGVSILQDLHRQRQVIEHSRDTLHGTDDNITTSRRILQGMSRRMVQNKLIMIGIILALLGAIILVVYFKVKS